MNRKEACKAISFILIFVLLLTGVSYIVRTNGDIKNRFAGFYAEEKNSIDVLMCGGSTIATSFFAGLYVGRIWIYIVSDFVQYTETEGD